MEKKTINNVKLGLFVLAGLVFLVVILYMIGRNMSLFGDTYMLKARFENAQGLVVGNNVRYAGIQAGTVKEIRIMNDTTIEVTLTVEKRMMTIIRKNAVVSIGTEGLVGNKVVNILPRRRMAPFAEEGDILLARRSVDTDEMLQTLSQTNNDVAVIAANLKITVQKINTSKALWELLNDKSIPANFRTSVGNIRTATANAGKMVNNLNDIVMDVKNGKGSVGAILKDTSFAKNLNEAIIKIKSVGDSVDSLSNEINIVVAGIKQDVNAGKGPANAILKDSSIVQKLNKSLSNIEKGTDGFNQNMEALKHNFLFRGYFKKLERQKADELKKQAKEGKSQ